MKKLIAGLLTISVVASGCANITQTETSLNKEIIKQKISEIKRNKREIKKKKQVLIELKKQVPLKVAIDIVCKQKGYVCDTSDIPSFLVATKRFKGDLKTFLRFLKKEYKITYNRYGKTLIFKVSDDYNKYYAAPLLKKRININVSNVAFEYFISFLSEKASVPIVLDDIEGEDVQPTTGATRTSKIGYISYYSENKTLKQILDEIAGQFNLYWTIKDGKIIVSKYQTASIKLNLPFLEKEINLKDDAYTLKYKKEFYKNLEENLRKVLKDKKSSVSITETGYVVVYARPKEVRLIKELVDKINEEFSKVIPLKLTIIAIRLKDQFKAGINLLDLKDLDEIGKTTNTTNVRGVLDLAEKGSFTLGITSKALDSVIEAVSEFGNVRIVENSEFRVLNGQPLVYKPLTKQRIVSNVSLTYVPVSAGESGGTTTQPTITMNTEDIESGSNLLIVPYYIDDGKVVIDLYRSQSQIESLQPFKVNLEGAENQLILPTVKKDTSIEQTTLEEGQKLILLSSVVEVNEMNNKGLPTAKDIPVLGMLGGKIEKNKGRYQYLIIVSYEEEL